MIAPPDVLRRYDLRDPAHVAETAIAHVWKVALADGTPSALKIYKDDDPKGEEIGFRFVQTLNGVGVVKVYHFDYSVAVMEWLDGPSLGDVSRDGNDDAANAILIEVADALHQNPIRVELPTLADNFAPLLTLDMSPYWAERTKDNLCRAQQIALHMLDNQIEISALHGDLHHDNIKGSTRGYLAYDAKGLIGDRAYELANAFQNPLGAEALVHDPARATRMAEHWAQAWNTSPKRLISWAVAHCGLSMTWAQNFEDKAHSDLLDMLCAVLDDA